MKDVDVRWFVRSQRLLLSYYGRGRETANLLMFANRKLGATPFLVTTQRNLDTWNCAFRDDVMSYSHRGNMVEWHPTRLVVARW